MTTGIERLGKPKIVCTDNESMWTSWLFRIVMTVLGIRHQRTQPYSPWQNGRVERLFGTLKRALRSRNPDRSVMQHDLSIFRAWYNHVRPHYHLEGKKPAEVWDPTAKGRRRKPRFFSEWDGTLGGFLR